MAERKPRTDLRAARAPGHRSPGPWHVVRHSWDACSIYGADKQHIATLAPREDDGEEDVDDGATVDAEFAARAVNAHDALVEALRNTLCILQTYDVSEEHGVVKQARAALELANAGR